MREEEVREEEGKGATETRIELNEEEVVHS